MTNEKPGPSARTVRSAQLSLVLGVAVILAAVYLFSDGVRSEVNRAGNILSRGDLDGLQAYIDSFGVWAPIASLGLMVFQALAAPIPGFVVVFANGLAFGVFNGWLLSLLGQTLAAAVCFGLARALGRGPIATLVGRIGLESADQWFARWGTYAVLAARLVPGMAFDVVSYAAGLTPMGFGRFIGATAIGAAPGTLLYAYLGQEAPQFGWVLLVATGVVGAAVAMSVVVRRRVGAATAQDGHQEATAIVSSTVPAKGVAVQRARAGLRAVARLLAESGRVRISVFALAGLLAYLVVGQIVEPGFTEYWGYLLIQITVVITAVIALSHRFAAAGGFSWLTYLAVIAAISVDTFGNTAEMYDRFETYDKFVHAGGTAAAAAASYDILAALNRRGRIAWPARRRMLAAIGVAMLLASGWEVYEFSADLLFETYRHAGPVDTIYDLISDAVGALAMSRLLYRRERSIAAADRLAGRRQPESYHTATARK